MTMQSTNTITQPIVISALAEELYPFTTLLQSGITLPCTIGTSLGVFLADLPGFDMHYITERIQTIFLDGNAIDDLERTLTEPNHTLALSAAMPGLAGAIFRKNSLHAALRTVKTREECHVRDGQQSNIHLKLFNMIAREKGEKLLKQGGIFSGKSILEFFEPRPSLLSLLSNLNINNQSIEGKHLLSSVDAENRYYLTIQQTGNQE